MISHISRVTNGKRHGTGPIVPILCQVKMIPHLHTGYLMKNRVHEIYSIYYKAGRLTSAGINASRYLGSLETDTATSSLVSRPHSVHMKLPRNPDNFFFGKSPLLPATIGT
jgi:hypothetical protein